MNEVLNKISSYNIFNYLFPGIIFVLFLSFMTSINLIQQNIIEGLFLYYFLGLVISRIGSLVFEPLLKLIRLVKFIDYGSYIKACKEDSKIELFSEINNSYRTLASTFSLVFLIKLYDMFFNNFISLNNSLHYFLLTILIIIFLFSYKKQTSFIYRRVNGE